MFANWNHISLPPDVYSIFGYLVTIKPSDFLTFVVSVAIGSITVWIANWQRRIAKEKVISDLFERRYAIYEIHVRAIRKVCIADYNQNEDYSIVDEASYASKQAQFILDNKTYGYLSSILMRLDKMLSLGRFIENNKAMAPHSTGARESQIKAFHEICRLRDELLLELGGGLTDAFMPFLKIKDFRSDIKIGNEINIISKLKHFFKYIFKIKK
ncbi:hypothetical protein Gdia_2733 [Gluconacetobacter diazotrophicus PA1 5]|nr:hypothetical protein Gdia_2733 [Gluconacetobacter diazotrophicus PA1 5]TWA97715.1 hypothetical protein FBZ86_1801 [Gluconacetobacter diazotrophicus]